MKSEHRQRQITGGSVLACALSAMAFFSASPLAQSQQPKAAKIISKNKSFVPAALTPEAKKGRQLFKQLECATCHSIDNAGGCLAPPLDGIGARRTTSYVQLRLGKNSEEQFVKMIGHPELFPHPRFSSQTVKSLTAYLWTLPEPAHGFRMAQHDTNVKDDPTEIKNFKPLVISADSAEGRRLFLDGGCMSCHAIGAEGGTLAPRLDGIGYRHSRAYIEAHINNPQAHVVAQSSKAGKSKMPQFDFAPTEVKQIADFLLTLPASK